MITAKEYLDKIKWDENCKESDYTIFYLDHTEEDLVAVEFDELIFPKKSNFYFSVWDNSEAIFRDIPYHRVRKIVKEEVVWERNNHAGDEQ